MPDLRVNYLGLELKNPLIAGSSGLTGSIEKIKLIERAGASAVVLKSLFEEQIIHDAGEIIDSHDYPEAGDYIMNYTRSNSVEKYLNLITEAKKSVSIPVIASINCISASDWTLFSRKIEEAGADALELNLFFLPTKRDISSSHYEKIYSDLVSKVSSQISIPIAVKLSNHFTNVIGVIDKIVSHGARGIVMFNRFYEPDIDIEQMKFASANVFSTASDLRHVLRWVALVSSRVNLVDISASTGIHSYKGIVKQILAGAKTVQVCSALYKNGVSDIETMLRGLTEWMERHDFTSIDQLRGIMNYSNIPDPAVYERSQFMKYFSSIE